MNSLNDFIKSPLAVVCHDAGAANLIVHWLRDYQGSVLACMEGPAKVIWERFFPNTEVLPLEDIIRQSDTLLSGTGWGVFEYNARVEARKQGVRNIAVIDHWTSYKERFIHDGVEIIPDVILVSDKFAKDQAELLFPNVEVIELDNRYLHYESQLVVASRREPVCSPPKKILAVMEPFRVEEHNDISLEFASLKYFISNLNQVTHGENIKVRIRTHPSESINKYDSFIEKCVDINMEVSKNAKLCYDLAWADQVVGMQSFAMVVAQNCNIPTMSILPPDSIEYILPYSKIISLRRLCK